MSIVGALAGIGLAKAAMWYLNGKALAAGFNSSASIGGSGSGIDSGSGPMGLMGRTSAYTNSGKGLSGKMGKFGKGMAGKGMGIGAIGMIGSMAMDYGRSELDDENGPAGKAMGVASSALSGAGTGAMIGSVIPVIGTAAGAIIGGLIGGITSAIDEYSSGGGGAQVSSSSINDGIIMDGKLTGIDTKDEVYKIAKPGGAFDKANGGSGANSSVGGSSTVHITFDEIKVSGSNGDVGKLDLSKDSSFMRELATKIKESLSTTANGGKLSPNPSN